MDDHGQNSSAPAYAAQALLAQWPSGLLVLDTELRIDSANEIWCKTLGWNERDVIGRPMHEFLSPHPALDVVEPSDVKHFLNESGQSSIKVAWAKKTQELIVSDARVVQIPGFYQSVFVSLSFNVIILFFLISTSLSASVVRPITQVILGFSFKLFGIEFSLTRGMFDVLKPLLAR